MMLTPEGAHATSSTASPRYREAQQGGGRRLIFVTNRGPVEYTFGADGTTQPQAGAGGGVSGLLSAARERPVSAISVGMTEAGLADFVHIPWPSAEQWADVPEEMVRAIYRGLAAVDVLGFQTARDVHNFLDGAVRFLPGVFISRDPDELRWRGGRTLVRAYPIAVTPSAEHAAPDAPHGHALGPPPGDAPSRDRGHDQPRRAHPVSPTPPNRPGVTGPAPMRP